MVHFHTYLWLKWTGALHYSLISCNTVFSALIGGFKAVWTLCPHAQGSEHVQHESGIDPSVWVKLAVGVSYGYGLFLHTIPWNWWLPNARVCGLCHRAGAQWDVIGTLYAVKQQMRFICLACSNSIAGPLWRIRWYARCLCLGATPSPPPPPSALAPV